LRGSDLGDGQARTSYHHLALDFKLGVLARVLEEEVDIADHGERSDILVRELETARCGPQRPRKNDERKFCKTKT
jgi:hypothetical protein